MPASVCLTVPLAARERSLNPVDGERGELRAWQRRIRCAALSTVGVPAFRVLRAG